MSGNGQVAVVAAKAINTSVQGMFRMRINKAIADHTLLLAATVGQRPSTVSPAARDV